ncbi:MAG: hypothetical protein K2Q22_17980, partial [Cytophagales bacterium]|nr:hypothetical protein [Cytophagales bacterium]
EQEDEHDCFSDYTNTEIALWQKGIENVYNGTYTRVNGTIISGQSLKSLIQSKGKSTADAVDGSLSTVDQKIAALTGSFDNLIAANSTQKYIVGDIITALKDLGQKMTDAVSTLGITNEYNQQSI